MAASDAIPVPRKNVAFRFYFAIRKPSDSTLITTWAGMDSEVSLDGAAYSDCTSEATEIGTTGTGYIDLTSSEMNADCVMLKVTVTNTGAVPLVFVLYPESAGDYRVDSSNSSVGSVSGAVGSVTGAVGSVTGNVGGNVVGTVASVVTKTGYSLTAGTGLGNQTADITGSLSGAVGSVTGAVGSVTGNVGGNVTGSVGSVVGAVGSVTGAVGSVTGNIGGNLNGNVVGSVASVAGNVSGSVGSVTGAVGSVTGSVGSVVGNVGGSTASVAGAVGSVTGNVGGDVSGKVLGGGAGTISGDGVRAASVTGAVGSVTGSVGSVVGAVALDSAARVKLDATQPDYVPATAVSLAAAKTILDKIDSGLVLDGLVYQFTANMLELAPAGGSGSADWTTDERAAIRAILGIPSSGSTPADPTTGVLDTIRDLVVAYIAAALATVNGTSGTIVGFPTTLNIGDSYTDDCNSAIHVFIRDENDDPIPAVGTHDFTDGDFAPECIITQNGNTGRVKCEVTYVSASPENYLKIQIPSKESRRATPGIATVQVLLKWDGAQKALSKQTVTWEGLI